MQATHQGFRITAIVYPTGADFEVFAQEITEMMSALGMRLAGLVQHSEQKPGRAKCDMSVRDLATGALHRISDDRGPHARGCVLNSERLLNACTAAEAGLSRQADLLVLSKFGKAEVEGGGFRSPMVKALDLLVPVLIGVPAINLVPFRAFAGDLAREIELSELPSDRQVAAEYLRTICRPVDAAMWARA